MQGVGQRIDAERAPEPSGMETFSVLERLLLLDGVLPAQGNIVTIRLVRKLREALSFSEAELQALNLRPNETGAGTAWERSADVPKGVDVGPKMRELIVSGLKRVSENGILTDDHLGLCDRFLPEENA